MTDKDSFLNEEQLLGKATEAIDINLDNVINMISSIHNKEVAQELKSSKEDDLPSIEMAFYCQDCKAITEVKVVKNHHKKRQQTVCSKCNSRHISRGRSEALSSYYHIGK